MFTITQSLVHFYKAGVCGLKKGNKRIDALCIEPVQQLSLSLHHYVIL